MKTNSKISLSSFNEKEDNIKENEKLLSQYENENRKRRKNFIKTRK